jgi:hypothetical protein
VPEGTEVTLVLTIPMVAERTFRVRALGLVRREGLRPDYGTARRKRAIHFKL